MRQITLDFDAGLLQRYPRWRDTFIHIVYSGRSGLNGAAGACDVSPTDLTKRLSGEHPDRPLRIDDIEKILEEKKDYLPIFWLIEKFLQDPDAKKQEALARIPGLMAALEATLQAAGGPAIKAVK